MRTICKFIFNFTQVDVIAFIKIFELKYSYQNFCNKTYFIYVSRDEEVVW